MAPNYVDFMDLQDLSVLCLDGFHMVQFWLDCKLKALLVGWARWYMYVDRVAVVGSGMTLLLEDEGKAAVDAEALAQQLWLAYRNYFGSRCVVEQPGLWGDRRNPEITYKDCEYEVEEDKLMCVTIEDECGDCGRLVNERMAVMPRLGDVFRTEFNAATVFCGARPTTMIQGERPQLLGSGTPNSRTELSVHYIVLVCYYTACNNTPR